MADDDAAHGFTPDPAHAPIWAAETLAVPGPSGFDLAQLTPGRMEAQADDPRRFSCVRVLGYAADATTPRTLGSGVLIGPDLILTAGHNLFDPRAHVYGAARQGYADRVRIESPSLSIPPEIAHTDRIVSTDGWNQSGIRAFDVGVIKLNGPLQAPAQPIEPVAATWADGPGADLYAYGFRDVARPLEVSPGDFLGFASSLAFYSASTDGGFSGGPLILSVDGQYVLAGIHRAGPGEAGIDGGCNGVVLTADVLTWIIQAEGVL